MTWTSAPRGCPATFPQRPSLLAAGSQASSGAPLMRSKRTALRDGTEGATAGLASPPPLAPPPPSPPCSSIVKARWSHQLCAHDTGGRKQAERGLLALCGCSHSTYRPSLSTKQHPRGQQRQQAAPGASVAVTTTTTDTVSAVVSPALMRPAQARRPWDARQTHGRKRGRHPQPAQPRK
jgi:hypothetical protein